MQLSTPQTRSPVWAAARTVPSTPRRDKKEKVSSIAAGDIGCVMKLKAGKTDVTLAAPGQEAIEHMVFPDAKYRCAVKAVDKNDEAKVGDAQNKVAAQDPTINVEYSKELRQTILSGMGEQHINYV